ncbi:multiple organellar RNA editing factor 8, chloroplastic/mitochondrial-like [Miscanthus floridulus]|uniref:multiple organellar RNA editing factor 8, chloroplastic/mitochondrial-like n=1 Tax=Miscanthus floridulus TaxID=154761 RepID=UPI00345B3D84
MASASRALLLSRALQGGRRIPTLLRPLAASASILPAGAGASSPGAVVRCFATQPATSSLRDSSPNWSNRPPKETILLEGCDFEHWLVVMEPPPGDASNPDIMRDEIIDSYIKTLAQVVGREIIGRRENAEKGPPEVSAIPPKNERRAFGPPKNSIPHPCLQALQVADAKKKWLNVVEEGKKKKKKKANPISPHHTARYSHLSQAPQQFLLHCARRCLPTPTVPAHPPPRRRPHLPHGAPARGRGLPLTPPPSSPRSYRTPPPPTSPTPPRLVGLPYAVRNPICALHHAAPLRPPLCYSTPPWLPCGSSTPSAALETDRTPRLLGTPLGSSTVSIQESRIPQSPFKNSSAAPSRNTRAVEVRRKAGDTGSGEDRIHAGGEGPVS